MTDFVTISIILVKSGTPPLVFISPIIKEIYHVKLKLFKGNYYLKMKAIPFLGGGGVYLEGFLM